MRACGSAMALVAGQDAIDPSAFRGWYKNGAGLAPQLTSRNALRRSNEEPETRSAKRTRQRDRVGAGFMNRKRWNAQETEVAIDFTMLAVILAIGRGKKEAIPPDARATRLLDGADTGCPAGAARTAASWRLQDARKSSLNWFITCWISEEILARPREPS
jgi:hypothetical protein